MWGHGVKIIPIIKLNLKIADQQKTIEIKKIIFLSRKSFFFLDKY